MALIVVSLLFAAIVTFGRVALGLFDASSSRYTTFTLLAVTGIYLTLLGPFLSHGLRVLWKRALGHTLFAGLSPAEGLLSPDGAFSL